MYQKKPKLKEGYSLRCESKSTRNGFKHIVDLIHECRVIDTQTNWYINRTWESYEYETAITNLLERNKEAVEEQ